MLSDWITELVNWLRQSLGVAKELKPTDPEIKIFFQSPRTPCVVYRYLDPKEEQLGVVEALLLDHPESKKIFFLLLVNLEAVRQALGEGAFRQIQNPYWRRALELRIRQEIENQRGINGSHLFIVGYQSREADRSRFVSGKPEYFKHLELLYCYLVSLEGEGRSILQPNYHARRIIQAAAIKAALLNPEKFQRKTRSFTWEEIFFLIDWLEWLEYYTRIPEKTKITDGHVLRPPKMINKGKI